MGGRAWSIFRRSSSLPSAFDLIDAIAALCLAFALLRAARVHCRLARMRTAIVGMVVFASSVACGGTVAGGAVVTLADYYELGEHNVAKALGGATPSAGRITLSCAASASQAVVRVRIQHDFQGSSYSTAHATGALVHHGKYVVTVAHELVIARDHADARIEILLGDGRMLAGRKRAFDHYAPNRAETDWVLIDVIAPPASLPSLELGDATEGERLVLGFPGRHGRDVDDNVVLDDAEKSLPLQPLRILCRTLRHDPAQLELIAGCVPTGGISGAPCVDASGRLISIQRGVTDTLRNGRAVTTLNVVATAELRAAIAKAESLK
jgi:hypothetical protein